MNSLASGDVLLNARIILFSFVGQEYLVLDSHPCAPRRRQRDLFGECSPDLGGARSGHPNIAVNLRFVSVDGQIEVRFKLRRISGITMMPNENGFPDDCSPITHGKCNGGFVKASSEFVGRGVVVCYFGCICHVCFPFKPFEPLPNP